MNASVLPFERGAYERMRMCSIARWGATSSAGVWRRINRYSSLTNWPTHAAAHIAKVRDVFVVHRAGDRVRGAPDGAPLLRSGRRPSYGLGARTIVSVEFAIPAVYV